MEDVTVLIADDEPNILLLTEMLFKDMGMTVITATDGQEALDKIFESTPDLVITDVIMPHKTGFEICKAVRANPSTENIPIIILSALGDEYNKITGFEGGADDYITKPFNVEELKMRSKTLLMRHKAREKAQEELPQKTNSEQPSYTKGVTINTTLSGTPCLDKNLFGGLPIGSNILLIGKLGSGKSTLARQFVIEGLGHGDRTLFVALDDNPQQIRKQFDIEGASKLDRPLEEFDRTNLIRFVDAYSWSTLTGSSEEPFAINGALELNNLAGVISDAGYDLGQTVQHKLGGRRVIDSISSLLVDFELPQVIRFINQVARTAVSFGGVTTLFIIEEGTVTEQVLNNIKYVMDGVIQLEKRNDDFYLQVSSMKWTNFNGEWAKNA